MNRLQLANLTACPTECVFGAKSVEFLGYQVGFDWITVNDDNFEKIRMAQQPTTKKEVRSFLGHVNYYRAHILLFPAISAPLSDLTRKEDNRTKFNGRSYCISPMVLLTEQLLLFRLKQTCCFIFREYKKTELGKSAS